MAIKSSKEFKEMTDAIIKNAKDKLTSESSKEEIQNVADLEKQLENVNNEYANLEKENQATKDMLIESMKHEGSKETAKDINDKDTPKTMLDIANELGKK